MNPFFAGILKGGDGGPIQPFGLDGISPLYNGSARLPPVRCVRSGNVEPVALVNRART